MRCMTRNMTPFFYALYDTKEPILDEYGNESGEYEVRYHKPERSKANISAAMGETNTRQFGEAEAYDKVIVIEKPEEAETLHFSRPIYLFSQTTKSVEEYHQLVEKLKSEITNHKSQITLEAYDTICRSVANRVEQLKAFAREQDLVLFVGGTKSSNAAVLFNHCKQANPNTLFITSPDEVEDKIKSSNSPQGVQIFKSSNCKVGICGATSTPLWLMEQVRDKLTILTGH